MIWSFSDDFIVFSFLFLIISSLHLLQERDAEGTDPLPFLPCQLGSSTIKGFEQDLLLNTCWCSKLAVLMVGITLSLTCPSCVSVAHNDSGSLKNLGNVSGMCLLVIG